MINKFLKLVLFYTSFFSYAQVTIGARANMLYKADTPSWTSIQTSTNQIITDNGKNNVGHNVGLSVKIDIPTSFFVMPEIYYTSFSNKFTDPISNTTLEAKSNKVDIPVLLGYNILGKIVGIFAGPVASYNLSKDNQYNDFKENGTKQFTIGYQFGAQAKISKLILNARYEGAFSNDQREFISTNISNNQNIRYDSRPSLLIFGLGYQF